MGRIFGKAFAAFAVAALIAGCSAVRVVRNPGEGDNGIRFYRPKPYLLVTPADPTGRMVNLKLQYLPDLNEEYSAHVRGKGSVVLKDGWNLVGVNTKEAPPEKQEPPAAAPAPDMPLPGAVVAATNVPIGYYESVYEMVGQQKVLQGWRYVGTTILGARKPGLCHRNTGPTPSNGGKTTCTDGSPAECYDGPLYGLVFFNGVMTFRQLDEIAGNQLCPMFVDPAPNRVPTVPTTVPTPVPPRTPPELVPSGPQIRTPELVPGRTPESVPSPPSPTPGVTTPAPSSPKPGPTIAPPPATAPESATTPKVSDLPPLLSERRPGATNTSATRSRAGTDPAVARSKATRPKPTLRPVPVP